MTIPQRMDVAIQDFGSGLLEDLELYEALQGLLPLLGGEEVPIFHILLSIDCAGILHLQPLYLREHA